MCVPTDLTLPNAVFETLASSGCLPALQCIDNIQPGSSVCDPLRCQVITVDKRSTVKVLVWLLKAVVTSTIQLVVVVVVVEMNIIKVALSHFCCRTTVHLQSDSVSVARQVTVRRWLTARDILLVSRCS